MTERKVLGRGLSSLIPPMPPPDAGPETSQERGFTPSREGGMLLAETESIRANPRQPRRRFSEKALGELADSIRHSGLLQPLLVRRIEGGYELLAGERRLRAARMVGLTRVPVVVRSVTDQSQLEVALIENLQREDLNPVEEAQGYERLTREFHLTQEEVAEKVGRDRSTVTNLLRLLKLSPTVQEMLASGALSMGHARALLPLEDGRRQEALAQRIEKEGLSVRQVERLVRSMSARTLDRRRATDGAGKSANLRHLETELQRTLGTRAEIVSRGKGGEIRLHYYGPEDLSRLAERLLNSTTPRP